MALAILLCFAGSKIQARAKSIEPECRLDRTLISAPFSADRRFVAHQVIVPRNNKILTADELAAASLKKRTCLADALDLCIYDYPPDCGDPPAVASALATNIFACSGKGRGAGRTSLAPKSIGKVFPNAVLKLVGDQGTRIGKSLRTVDDEYFRYQTSLSNMGAESAWDFIERQPFRVVTTAIVDNGVQLTHPDLKGQLYPGIEIPCRSAGCDGGKPRLMHGTAMAGIVGAGRGNGGIVGTAWMDRLLPIKISATDEYTFEAAAIVALRCALHRGAKVINFSYASDTPTDALADEIENASGEFLVAVPTGNISKDIGRDPIYPAAYGLDRVIAVMSHDSYGGPSTNSGWGGATQIAAPGDAIYTGLCPKSCYGQGDDTSSATAYVSGAAALVWSVYWNWSAQDVKNHIINSGIQEPRLDGCMAKPRRLDLANLFASSSFESSAPFAPAMPASIGSVCAK